MPIVKHDNGSVTIEYEIPSNVKEYITVEFLKEFRNQLYRMHEYYSLELFADEGIVMNTSTAGWYAAFGKACLLMDKTELLTYWLRLDWYDSDIFDGEIADMLITNNIILDSIDNLYTKYVSKDTSIAENIYFCDKCYELYHKKDIDILNKDDEIYFEDSDYIQHVCHKCNGKNKTIKSIRQELLENIGSIQNLIKTELNEHELCTCSKCKKIYTKNMGKSINSKFTCNFCEDKNNTKDKEYNTTDYYRSVLEELKEWKQKNLR